MNANWYCRAKGQIVGPFSGLTMRQFVAHGRVLPATLVRREQDGQWIPARLVSDFFPEPTTPQSARVASHSSPAAPLGSVFPKVVPVVAEVAPVTVNVQPVVAEVVGPPMAGHDLLPLGCPACHGAITASTSKLGMSTQCPRCGHEFTVPSKDALEKSRQEFPPHHWLVVKENRKEVTLQGIEILSRAISNGLLLPEHRVVTGPLMPAEPARLAAGRVPKLRKLYDPLWVFADFWSWPLVVVVPAACLSLVSTVAGGPVGLGVLWLVVIVTILAAMVLSVVVTVLMRIPVIGPILVFLITGFLGYFLLLLVAVAGLSLLGGVHEAMRPIARLIGRHLNIERQRIPNWQAWMMA